MKKMLLTNILFLSFCSLVGQNAINTAFTSTCIGNGFIAPTCVEGWYASSGYPMVLGDIKTNTWAALTSSQNKVEGIFTNYSFVLGKTYILSFRIKTETDCKGSIAAIKATTGLSHLDDSQADIIKANDELIWSKEFIGKSNKWELVSLKFTPSKNNYQLWLYTTVSPLANTNGYAQIELDDIEISNNDKSLTASKNKKDDESTSSNFSKSEYIFPENINKGDYLNVRVNTDDVLEIHIIDLAGHVFKTNFTVINRNYINLLVNSKTILEGTYVVKIIKKNNIITTKKLIVS